MIRNVWTVLCERAISNKQTNNPTLVEGLETLTFMMRPSVESKAIRIDFRYMLATYWFNDDSTNARKGIFKVSAVTALRRTHELIQVSLDLEPRQFNKSFINLQTFPIDGQGLYYVEVHLKEEDMVKWKRVATTPLVIKYDIREDAPLAEFNVPAKEDA